MPRPIKCRRVSFMPGATYFKPAGIPMRELEENGVSVEEMEAVRLRDIDGLEQEECARAMNISRQTFQRILESARKKIADALLKGKAIRIEGGHYEMTGRRFRCRHGHEWNARIEAGRPDLPETCPRCDSSEITAVAGKAEAEKGR